MNRATVHLPPTGDQTRIFQIYIPNREPKLALNGSHWLLADERIKAPVKVGGVDRTADVMVKIWVPIPRRERDEEAKRKLRMRLEKRSPILI